MKVYLVETGDYEQRHVMLVAVSLQAAVDEIKRVFSAPYIVHWHDLKDESWQYEGKPYEEWGLMGDFERVAGFSTRHTGEFTISSEELIGANVEAMKG